MPLDVVAPPGTAPTTYIDQIKLAKVKWSDNRPTPITPPVLRAASASTGEKK